MMSKKMCGLHKVAWALLLIGGANWLLVGLLQKDLFGLLGMGMDSVLARAVYLLVGLAAVAMLGLKKCCAKCECGDKECKDCGPKSESPKAPEPPKAA
jgi:uncharacterized protein